MTSKILRTQDLASPLLNTFKFCGCDPKYSGKAARVVYWYFTITNWIIFVLTLIKGVQQDSMEIFTQVYLHYLITSQTAIKGLYFFIHRKKISHIFDVFLNDFWPVDKIAHLTKEHNAVYRMTATNTKVYRTLLFLTIAQISVFPIIFSMRVLPYSFYMFGFEDTVLLESPYYELTYIWQCWTISVPYVVLLVAYDLLFIVLGGSVTVQFDILKHVLGSVGDHEADEEQAHKILKKSIQHHNMLLKFVDDLEHIVTVPILKQYLDAISAMGLYIYMLQQEFNYLYMFSLLANMSQTLFFSIFGQIIQDKSLAIADAAYENNWQNLRNRRLQRPLILIMQRAQRPCTITAGGFITLSFESFVGMVKTAASFLAVLRSASED